MNRIIFKTAIFIFQFVGLGVATYAYSPAITISSYIERNNIIKGAVQSVQSDKYPNTTPLDPNSYSGCHIVKSNGRVSLNILPNLTDVCFPAIFTYKVKLRITTYDKTNSPLIHYKDLEVSYDKSGGKKYKEKDFYQVEDAHRVEIEILDIVDGGNTANKQFLEIKVEVEQERYNDFITSSLPDPRVTIDQIVYDNITNDISITIKVPNDAVLNNDVVSAATEYDLEWTFIEAYDVNGLLVKADLATFDLRNNVSRVTLSTFDPPDPNNTSPNSYITYKISRAFNTGYLICRARAVGKNYLFPDRRVEGNWSYETPSSVTGDDNVFNILSTPNPHPLFPPDLLNNQYLGLGIYCFTEPINESNLNWHYECSFAEEGKKSEVISFFDGSLRARQTVIKSKSENDDVALVQDKIYDYQGRAAIEVLPTPAYPSALKYFNGFTKNLNGTNYSRSDFDLDGNDACKSNVKGLSNSNGYNDNGKVYGPGIYYSLNSAFTGTDPINFSNYVPVANKFPIINPEDNNSYPFVQTEFTPDNTGRVSRKSAPGVDHKLDSRHETVYDYVTPNQPELDMLFGSEVGYAEHYKKNSVIDANGQVSVSYLNLKGQVVATALASPSRESTLTDIDRNAPPPMSVNLMNSSKTEYTDDALISAYTFLVTEDKDYSFMYSVIAQKYSADCSVNYCADCVYDLDISLTNSCGDEQLKGEGTSNAKILIHRVIGNTADVNGIASCDADVTYDFRHDTKLSKDPADLDYITLNLKQGTYTIIKKLTVNKTALDEYTNDYLANASCIKTLQTFEENALASTDLTGCNLTCEQCNARLGSQEDYMAKKQTEFVATGKASSISNISTDDFNAMLNSWKQRKQTCDDLCLPKNDECDALEAMLIADITPGSQAQYARCSIVDDISSPDYGKYDFSSSASDVKSILNRLSSNDVSYYNPSNYLPNKYYEKLSDKTVIVTEQGVTSSKHIWELTQVQLVENFNYEWAQEFVKGHPEYCHVLWCKKTSNLNSSNYDKQMLETETFADALSKGYLNPFGSMPSPVFDDQSLSYLLSSGFDPAAIHDPFFKPGNCGVEFVGNTNDTKITGLGGNDDFYGMWNRMIKYKTIKDLYLQNANDEDIIIEHYINVYDYIRDVKTKQIIGAKINNGTDILIYEVDPSTLMPIANLLGNGIEELVTTMDGKQVLKIHANHFEQVFSMWEMPVMTIFCADKNATANKLRKCVDQNLENIQNCSDAIKNRYWVIFRALYLANKGYLANYAKRFGTACTSCVVRPTTVKRIYPPLDGVANEPYALDPQTTGFDPGFELAKAEGKLTGPSNSACSKQCSAYASYWMRKLEGCIFISQQSYNSIMAAGGNVAESLAVASAVNKNKVRDELIKVCENGCDANNPLGSINVKPELWKHTPANDAIAPYKSFRDVLKNALKAAIGRDIYKAGICDDVLITMPKEYGHPYFANESAYADTCSCNKDEYNYFTDYSDKCQPPVSPENTNCPTCSIPQIAKNGLLMGNNIDDKYKCKQCIQCLDFRDAFQNFYNRYPLVSEADPMFYDLFENYLNIELKMNLSFNDYMQFAATCINTTLPSSSTLSEFKNQYDIVYQGQPWEFSKITSIASLYSPVKLWETYPVLYAATNESPLIPKSQISLFTNTGTSFKWFRSSSTILNNIGKKEEEATTPLVYASLVNTDEELSMSGGLSSFVVKTFSNVKYNEAPYIPGLLKVMDGPDAGTTTGGDPNRPGLDKCGCNKILDAVFEFENYGSNYPGALSAADVFAMLYNGGKKDDAFLKDFDKLVKMCCLAKKYPGQTFNIETEPTPDNCGQSISENPYTGWDNHPLDGEGYQDLTKPTPADALATYANQHPEFKLPGFLLCNGCVKPVDQCGCNTLLAYQTAYNQNHNGFNSFKEYVESLKPTGLNQNNFDMILAKCSTAKAMVDVSLLDPDDGSPDPDPCDPATAAAAAATAAENALVILQGLVTNAENAYNALLNNEPSDPSLHDAWEADLADAEEALTAAKRNLEDAKEAASAARAAANLAATKKQQGDNAGAIEAAAKARELARAATNLADLDLPDPCPIADNGDPGVSTEITMAQALALLGNDGLTLPFTWTCLGVCPDVAHPRTPVFGGPGNTPCYKNYTMTCQEFKTIVGTYFPGGIIPPAIFTDWANASQTDKDLYNALVDFLDNKFDFKGPCPVFVRVTREPHMCTPDPHPNDQIFKFGDGISNLNCGSFGAIIEELIRYGCGCDRIYDPMLGYPHIFPGGTQSSKGCEDTRCLRPNANLRLFSKFMQQIVAKNYLQQTVANVNIIYNKTADVNFSLYTTRNEYSYVRTSLYKGNYQKFVTWRYIPQRDPNNQFQMLITDKHTKSALIKSSHNRKVTFRFIKPAARNQFQFIRKLYNYRPVCGYPANYFYCDAIMDVYDPNRWQTGTGIPPQKDTVVLLGSVEDIGELQSLQLFSSFNCCAKLCNKSMVPVVALEPCEETLRRTAKLNAWNNYNIYIDGLRSNFRNGYIKACMGKVTGAPVDEAFAMKYTSGEYHYTLYYYDQAGNLNRTVPPAGVRAETSQAVLDNIVNARNSVSLLSPDHKLVTSYEYNTLNQLIKQETPDAGVSEFYYDGLGRIIFSENAKQHTFGLFSYTMYDGLGRIAEVGELTPQSNGTPINHANSRLINFSGTTVANGTVTQVTKTYYDEEVNPPQQFNATQDNLRNRVVKTTYQHLSRTGNYDHAVYYSYDIHGNVKTLIRQISALNAELDEEYKTVHYDYDLISGKVNTVVYQKGYSDQYIHQYSYDGQNRLTYVESGVRTETLQKDAHYQYYLHGPLARTELGNNIQGIDYAYTIQGWLKSVNSGSLDKLLDMGKDGVTPNPSNSNIHQNFPADVFGFVLQYYQKDYGAAGGTSFETFAPATAGSDLANASNDLYNGNIKMMTTAIGKFMENNEGPLGTAYTYDQLNRILEAKYFNQMASNTWPSGTGTMNDYHNKFTYDANGNITSQLRNGSSLQGISMDNLSYQYNWVDPADHFKGLINNQLAAVFDAVGMTGYEDDIKSQIPVNYEYDEIGNMVKDVSEEIDRIEWTVYGKIRKIIRTTTSLKPDIEFEYTPDGHRVVKIVIPKNPEQLRTYLYYVRDAQGNILATYERKHDKIIDYDGLTYEQVNNAIISRTGNDGFASFMAEEHDMGKSFYTPDLIDQIQNSLVGLTDIEIKNFLLNNSPISKLASDATLFNAVVGSYDVTTYVNKVLQGQDATTLITNICQCLALRNNSDPSVPQMHKWLSIGPNEREWFFRALADLDPTQFQNILNILGITWTGDINAAITDILAVSNPDDIANAIGATSYVNCNQLAMVFDHLKSMNQIKYLELLATIPDVQAMTYGGINGCAPIDATTIATALFNHDPTLLWTKMITLGNTTDLLAWLKNNALRDYLYTTGLQQPVFFTQYQQVHNMYSTTGTGIKEYFALMRNYFGQTNYDFILSSFYNQSLTYTDSFNLSEHHIYGSSRLGICKAGMNMYYAKVVLNVPSGTSPETQPEPLLNTEEFSFARGEKNYELSNHLGNVLTVVSDKKMQVCSANAFSYYVADVITASDYSPFGAPLPDRQFDIVNEQNRNILAQNNFDTDEEGWSNTTGATVQQNTGKLQVDITAANAGASKYVSTLQGKDYMVKLTVDIGTAPTPIRLYVKNAGSPTAIASLMISSNGTYRLKFRATGGNTTVYITSTLGATATFYIDAVTVEEDKLSKAGYRFGFNGKEDDKETQTQDYGMRIYDYRLGRFLSVDPLTKSYPFYTPYQFAGNTPIAAVDLDGEEPKIVVTNQVTGYTEIKVYGAGNVQTMVVETFKAIVQYTDANGVTTELGAFNVTRDGWYDMGTDANGNTILCNRSSDPASGASKVFIQSSSSQQYGQGAPSFTMSPILSPIDQDCNQTFYDKGQAGDPLPQEVIRTNNTAQGAQFHVGGYYEKPNGNISLGGTYGCYGVVDPTQVSPTNTPTINPVTSNGEMQRFGNAIQNAQTMQVNEHKKTAKVEVEIQPRKYDTTKTVSP